MKKRLDFPEGYGQCEDGWCGPNLMRQVILYMKGLYIPEKKLVNISNCSIKRGTSVENMLKMAHKFNLKNYTKNNSEIEDLIYSINRGNPAILLIQAWPFKKVNDWSNAWENGHYVGANGYDEKQKKIFYYDPCDGKNKPISYETLDEVWHDKDSENIYEHFGMFFLD